jgi:hypothetical protein
VSLRSNTGGVELSHNDRIGSAVTVSGNSGAGPFIDDGLGQEVEANTIWSTLSCSGNSPAARNDGQPNTVSSTRSGECGAAGF